MDGVKLAHQRTMCAIASHYRSAEEGQRNAGAVAEARERIVAWQMGLHSLALANLALRDGFALAPSKLQDQER